MKTFLTLSNVKDKPLPEPFQSDDVRYTEALVERFLNEFTHPGDRVLDPFMGYGTTLLVAERMGREGYGIEFDENRCRYVRSLLQHPERALVGDSTKLGELDLPLFDFSMTSPPYMGHHHTQNPFTAYGTEGEGYEKYLDDLRSIYEQVKLKLKPAAHALVEVSNLKHNDAPITTLAWDIARAVSEVLSFQGEIIVAWEPTYAYGYDHSYCLVFKNE